MRYNPFIMYPTARILIIAGLVLLGLGVVWHLASLFHIPFGKLPGDIFIKGRWGAFYFPIVTCALLSFLATTVVYLWNSLK